LFFAPGLGPGHVGMEAFGMIDEAFLLQSHRLVQMLFDPG